MIENKKGEGKKRRHDRPGRLYARTDLPRRLTIEGNDHSIKGIISLGVPRVTDTAPGD
jgi:hypothetical protein